MVKYKYDPYIAQKIIEIVGGKNGINAYKLDKAVKESLGDRIPSKSHITITRQQLEKWRLLEKKKGENDKDLFYLSKLWNILSQFGYQPHDIDRFLMISQIICVASLIGVSFLSKSKEPSRGDIVLGKGLIADNIKQINPNEISNYSGYRKKGVSKEDIMRKRYRNPTNYQDLQFSSQEIDNYLKFLVENHLIRQTYDNLEGVRYVIHPEVEQFYLETWLDLFNSIVYRILILTHFPREISAVEREWFVLHHGTKQYQTILMLDKHEKGFEKDYRLKKGLTDKEIKKIEKERKIYRIKKLKEANRYINTRYENINEKYEKTKIGIPGLKELIISFICPQNILNIIKKDLK